MPTKLHRFHFTFVENYFWRKVNSVVFAARIKKALVKKKKKNPKLKHLHVFMFCFVCVGIFPYSYLDTVEKLNATAFQDLKPSNPTSLETMSIRQITRELNRFGGNSV